MVKTEKNIQNFLEKFKLCENAIRKTYGENYNFKWYEEKMTQESNSISQKMYVCRVLRNYISHNPNAEDFIDISSNTIHFLEELEISILSHQQTCKEKMKRIKPLLNPKSKILDAVSLLQKIPYVPILNENNIIMGLFTDDVLKKAILTNTNIKKNVDISLLIPSNKILFFSPSECYADAIALLKNKSQTFAFITDDGTKNGKFMGYISI